jgi:hypothetical protein
MKRYHRYVFLTKSWRKVQEKQLLVAETAGTINLEFHIRRGYHDFVMKGKRRL